MIPVAAGSQLAEAGDILKHGIWLLCGTVAACGGGAEERLVPGDAGRTWDAASAPDAGGHAGGGGTPPVLALRTAAIVSAPPRYVVAGETYRYRPTANGTLAGLRVEEGPAGLQARDGVLAWEPSSDQGGQHRVTVRGQTALGPATQTFNLDVASGTPRARGQVAAGSGGTVIAPGAVPRWRGVGVSIPRGALSAATEVTVSELDRAPTLPNARSGLRPVRFQPDGTVFAAPAQVMLPLPEGIRSAARLRAYVYDPTGHWERVPVVAVDTDSNLMIARASHFSVYAAVEPNIELSAALTPAAQTSPCAGALLGRASLDVPLSSVQVGSVNNLSPTMSASLTDDNASVRDLLALPGLRGSVRAVRVLSLREPQSEVVAEETVAVSTLYAPGDGSVTVTATDGLGNPVAQNRYPNPAAAVAEIEDLLAGVTTGVRFLSTRSDGQTLAARLHFTYADGDAAFEPVDTRDLGLAAAESDPVPLGTPTTGLGDVDCDGTLDSFDGFDDTLAPRLEVEPRQVVRLYPNEPVTLRARISGATSSAETWQVIDGANAKLEPATGGRVFSGPESGRYLVSYRATSGAETYESVFAVDVIPPPTTNTPPRCQPSKTSDAGRVGEPLDLMAVASDAETEPASLRLEWGLFDAATGGLTSTPQLVATGARARLVATQAGTYIVGCRAFDGQLQGAVGTVELTAAAQAENRLPSLTISPRETTITAGQTAVVRAWASDPDRDSLTSTWTVDGKPATASGTPADAKLVVTGNATGTVTVTVDVSDSKGASRATALVHVEQAGTKPVDADGDGFFAGLTAGSDCNDTDLAVYPGAPELCNKIDDDCDGQTDEGTCSDVTCQLGYRPDGKGGCADIDECATNNGGCAQLTQCMNTEGSFRCGDCPAGYTGGGGTCTDIDECVVNNGECSPQTICTNTLGGRTCGDCPAGYTGSGTTGCTDVDECATNNGGCDMLTRCVNIQGGRTCGSCPPGYTGSGTTRCTDVDECTTVKGACDPRTSCTNVGGGFRCGECPAGFVGSGSSSCDDINECAVKNGGCDPLTKCTNEVGSFSCSACPPGYSGTGAAGCVDVDECKVGNGGCDQRVTCTNSAGSFSCGGCPSGYTGGGAGGCKDIDECLISNGGCDKLTTCTNTQGGRICGSCPQGYTGNGETGCADRDECKDDPQACSAGRTCTNKVGSYECACATGFTFDGTSCVDVDECNAAQNPCGAGAACTNTVGSYQCGCPPNSFDDNLDGKVCSRAVALTSYSSSFCALTDTSVLYCWGYGVKRVTSFNDWSSVARGGNHLCGIRGGRLYCWQGNDKGQLGIGSTSGRTEPTQVGTDTDWTQVSAAYWGTCGMRAGGLVYCWGSNEYGELSQGPEVNASFVPVRVGDASMTSVIAGSWTYNCALKSGRLYCWGSHQSVNRHVFKEVSNEAGWSWISQGYTHICGIRNEALYCWGRNENGQLGIGVFGGSASITRVGSDLGWRKVFAHERSTCGLIAGKIFCWGDFGLKMGKRSTPTQIGADNDWTDVTVGQDCACGIRQGTVYCWGKNDLRQLGNDTTDDSSEPIPIITPRR